MPPIPIRGEAGFRYQLAAATEVDLQIFSVDGRRLANLVDRHQKPRYYSLQWSGGCGPVLDVWDLGGRLVREIAVDRVVPEGMRWIWDGCDSSGTAVPAGLYMVKVRGTGNALCAKVLRLR